MNRLALAVATWFGCGYFPWGPGTVGSLVAIGIAGLLHHYSRAGRGTMAALSAALFVPAIWAATRTTRLLQREDPAIVVVDEVVGQWATLVGALVFEWRVLLAGFVLFRIFDIWKPWPVRQFEKLPEGVGIVADDVAAGIYGALILYIGGKLKFY